MPWKGVVTVSEQRENFIRDYYLRYYSLWDLAERYSVSRKTAYKWIDRYEGQGREGLQDLSRRPHSCPWQTERHIAEALVQLRLAHPSWGPRKLLDILQRRHPQWDLPVVSTAAQILTHQGLVRCSRRHRRAHPGCPQASPRSPTRSGGPTTRDSSAWATESTAFPKR